MIDLRRILAAVALSHTKIDALTAEVKRLKALIPPPGVPGEDVNAQLDALSNELETAVKLSDEALAS